MARFGLGSSILPNILPIPYQYLYRTFTVPSQYLPNTFPIPSPYIHYTFTIHSPYIHHTFQYIPMHSQYIGNTFPNRYRILTQKSFTHRSLVVCYLVADDSLILRLNQGI